LEILRRRGVLKAKIFKGRYEPKLEFRQGWGVHSKKTLRGRSMDIFWNNTLLLSVFLVFWVANFLLSFEK